MTGHKKMWLSEGVLDHQAREPGCEFCVVVSNLRQIRSRYIAPVHSGV